MKQIIRLEEMAMTAAAIYLISTLDLSFNWWVYLLIFFAPDIGIAGYLAGNKTGAVLYNLFHHKGIAILVIAPGVFMGNDYWLLAGLILFAHSSFDRIFGFGLKHFAGFKHTHLGVMN